MTEKVFYDVAVERTTSSRTVIRVKADSRDRALELASQMREEAWFKSLEPRYQALDARVSEESHPLPPECLGSYREYLKKCLDDADFPLEALESYLEFRERTQTRLLQNFAEQYGVESSDLDAAVHEDFSEQAAAVNNSGLEAQLQHLLESFGFEATRQLVLDAIDSNRQHHPS